MSNWLTTLRKKPKHVRDNIAFAMSGAVTVCILATFWLFGGIGPHTLAGSENSGPHFFKTFFGEFGKQVATIKDSLPDKKEASTTAESHPESGPAVATSSGWAIATGTAPATPPPRQIMIITTTSTPATTSTPME